MLTLIVSFSILAFSLLFRLAHRLRLTLPLLYLLTVPTLLRGWYLAHTALAAGIFYAMVALVAVSWLVTLVRIALDAIETRTADNIAVERFAERVRAARANGEMSVSTERLW